LLAIVRGTGRLDRPELLRRAQRVAAWATRVRIGAAALELVLTGELDVVVPARSDEPLGFVRCGSSTPAGPNTIPTTPRASRRTGAA